MKFLPVMPIVKKLEAKKKTKHFSNIDKCHNFVRNYRDLSIKIPKRGILNTNIYAKFQVNPLILNLLNGNEVRRTDGQTDGRTYDGQPHGRST